MIDEDRLRSRMHRAIGYQAPSPGFGMQPLPTIHAGGLSGRKEGPRYSNMLAVVAVLLAVALVITLISAARAFHLTPSIPGHQGPTPPRLIKSSGPPCGGPGSAGPVKMFSSGAGWASGPDWQSDGTVIVGVKGPYRTLDGGAHWTRVAPPAIANLSLNDQTEFFLDSTHAWVAEAGGSARVTADHVVVFSTDDGGQTWHQSAPLRITPTDPSDVIWGGSGTVHWMCFIDSLHGALLIESGPEAPFVPTWRTGALYRTADGGLSWTLIVTNPGLAALKTLGGSCAGGFGIGDGMVFSSSLTGWLQTNGCALSDGLLVTRDGGITWAAQRMPWTGNNPTSPYFIDSDHGFIAGSYSLAATADGGMSWVIQGTLPNQCGGVTFIDSAHGWCIAYDAAGTNWDLYRTTDGGHTWSRVSALPAFGWITFVDAQTGFLTAGWYPGSSNWIFFKTTNGGKSWTRVQ